VADTRPSIAVLYRDRDVVVVDKPAGILTHPSAMSRDRDVAMFRARDTVGQLVYPVHRLDRGTSGALAFALSSAAAANLGGQFAAQTTKKVYLALVRGPFRAPVYVDYAIPCDEGGVRVAAQTTLTPLATSEFASLVLCQPHTGRFHQIRRHLSHLRYPIANDSNYGTGWFNRALREKGLNRLGLHACSLRFARVGAAEEAVIVRAEVPAELRDVLIELGLWDAAKIAEYTGLCGGC
jgi:tRNA pseudouridine65 synthase